MSWMPGSRFDKGNSAERTATWQPYKDGMEIVGKLLRVAGSEKQHNEMRNVYDGHILKVPAGLIGRCDLVTPGFIKITFRRYGNNVNSNVLIWKRFSDLSAKNLETGVLVAYLHPSRLRGMEVEAR